MTRDTLDANAWIQAAFRALTHGGPQAIRAEAIARDLRVSKGSFYWHFQNVGALKTRMLHHWKEEATENIIAALETNELPAAEKLKQLVELATGDANAKYGGPLAEAAIRDWARYDTLAAETVQEVDHVRLRYLNTLFEQNGANASESRTHSEIFYGALIGLEALSHTGSADLRRDLSDLLEILLKTE